MRELKEMNELILIMINKVIFVVLLMENNANTLFRGLVSSTNICCMLANKIRSVGGGIRVALLFIL